MSSRRLLFGAGLAVLLLTTAGLEEGAGPEGPPDAEDPAPEHAGGGGGGGGALGEGQEAQGDEELDNSASSDAGSAPQEDHLDPHCAHGSRVELAVGKKEARRRPQGPRAHGPAVGKKEAQFRCDCWDGWRTAGITDTLDWIEGSCNQFQCKSDKHCQETLGIEGAECPVQGWNCYCGWKYAVKNGWRGWDPLGDGVQKDGECMGVMYTLSVDGTRTLRNFLEWAWMPFVTMAVLLLPFGRKRAVCDHHKPSLWNGIRKCFGCTIECTGGCVMSTIYDLDVFKDDIAWTIWALDVMVWVYLFTLVLLITMAWISTLIVWAVLLLALMIALVAGVCMMCFAGADGGGGGEGCDCFKICEGGGADAAGCGGAECCSGLCGGGAVEGGAFYEPFYWGGPMPVHTHGCFYSPYYDYGYGYHGGNECNCCDRRNACCNFLCKPVALLLYVYPTLPENMWGGLLGYFVMGTHHMTPEDRAYQGGNWLVDLMMWRRPADLHGDDGWRAQVHNFLVMEDDFHDNPVAAQPGGPLTPGQEPLYHQPLGEADDPNIVRIPGSRHCRAFKIDRPFNVEDDRLWESSFEDYKKNVCWICQSSNDTWDTWMSCRHMFCESCSTQMLKRRMPCPLCRVSSNTVLRGPKYPWAPAEGASSTEPYGARPQPPAQQPMRDPACVTPQEQMRPSLMGQRSMFVDGRVARPGGQRNSRDAPPL